MRKRKKKKSLKLKYIFIFLSLLSFGAVGMILFFHLDPALLTRVSFYLDLANPAVKIVKVQEGLRKEEVAEVVGAKLGWTEEEKQDFLKIQLVLNSIYMEGHYFPETYLINKDEAPVDVSATMIDESIKQVDKIGQSKKSLAIDHDTAIRVASIIQREAAGKSDMRLISGIIWNRIAEGMKLQIDATLQYAKGSEEEGWWAKVTPEDKKIKSEYNTYMYEGLPPSAISNPGPDAIYAAFHPEKTDCLYYLHDKNRKIHCAKTYKEHMRNIEIFY